jgi:hypothetical protein
MRAVTGGCALTIAAALVAPNAAAQPPVTAGATRPHLRVLQALPESQLFPLMNLVATSLGVRCEYCHVQAAPDFTRTPSNLGGWAWDRDDKPQKRTALEMMRMVVDLNASRFRGEARITCYTCHRGATQPGRTPPLPPPADITAPAAAPPLPSADRLWASYLNAVGRVDSAAGSRGVIMSGWDDRSEGRYGRLEVVVAGPNRFRATLSGRDGTTSQGLDGDSGWVATSDRVIGLGSEDVARLRRIAMRYDLVKAERPANLQVTGVERLFDQDVYVATAKVDALTTRTLYFDIVTGLLRRDVTTTETLLLPLQEQVDYDDYRDVNGAKLPFRMRTSDGAPYSTATRTFVEIHLDAVDDARFRPPSAPR